MNMTLTETKMDLYNIRRSYTTLDKTPGAGATRRAHQVSRPLTRGSTGQIDHYGNHRHGNHHHGNSSHKQIDDQSPHLTESLMIRPLTVSSVNLAGPPQARPSHSAGLTVERSQLNMYIPGKDRPEKQPEKMAVTSNREEAPVSKATVPKRGLIKLTALQFEQEDPNYFDRNREQREKNRLKTKPVPMNHKKLMDKQRRLGAGGHEMRHSETNDSWVDLVPEEYTVGDLQKKILQFADFAGADRNPYLSLNAVQPIGKQQGPQTRSQGPPTMSYDMDVESVTSEVTMATPDETMATKKIAVVPRSILPTLPPGPSERRHKPDPRYPALRS